MAGEDAVERAVARTAGRARRRGRTSRSAPARRAIASIAVALVEPDDLAPQVPREEAGAAGDVERPRRWERRRPTASSTTLSSRKLRPLALRCRARRATSRRTPGARRRSTPSRVPRVRRAVPARVGAELLRGPRPGDDRRASPPRSPRGRACSTSTLTRITTGRSSRSSGDEAELVEALLAGIGRARERIDLRRHEGAHPRVGAADVVPVVAVRPEDLDAREGDRARAGPPGRRRARPARLPLRRAHRGPRPGVLPARWARRAAAPDRRGRAAGRLRPCAARSGRRRRARRRAPAADRLQRQPADATTSRSRGRSPPSCGRGAAGSRACGRSASRCRAGGSCR